MNKRTPWIAILSLCLTCQVGGCAEAPTTAVEKSPPLQPALAHGKADVADRVAHKGRLEHGTPIEDTLSVDLEFHAYSMEVFETSTLTLEVTHRGSARGLDTTMFLFGPSERGSFGDKAIAIDDDSGYGALSKLEGLHLEAGRYLVVIGTADGTGRGHYRLLSECLEGTCQPPPDDSESPIVLRHQSTIDALAGLLESAADACLLHCDMKATAFTYTAPQGSYYTIVALTNAAIGQLLDRELEWLNEGASGPEALVEALDRLGASDALRLIQQRAGSRDFVVGWASSLTYEGRGVEGYHDAYIIVFPEVGFGVALEISEFVD